MDDNNKTHPVENETVPPVGTPSEVVPMPSSKAEAEDQSAVEPLAAADALASELDRARAEVAALKDQLLRALADAENMRRRARREVEDTAKFAVAGLAREILPAVDNLRRALELADPTGPEAIKSLLGGVELTERELLAVLDRQGIKRVDPKGGKFDHNLHQALFEVETADVEPGTVVQVVAPGYVIHDRLLRPAMVGVAKMPKGHDAPMPPETRIDTVV